MNQNNLCFGKKIYDKKSAQTVKNQRLKGGNGRGKYTNLRIYPCNQCFGWHLSSHYLGEEYK